eukprot:657115-Pelagomonas_calceolata.AAC.2
MQPQKHAADTHGIEGTAGSTLSCISTNLIPPQNLTSPLFSSAAAAYHPPCWVPPGPSFAGHAARPPSAHRTHQSPRETTSFKGDDMWAMAVPEVLKPKPPVSALAKVGKIG